jgi:hypothetical protein
MSHACFSMCTQIAAAELLAGLIRLSAALPHTAISSAGLSERVLNHVSAGVLDWATCSAGKDGGVGTAAGTGTTRLPYGTATRLSSPQLAHLSSGQPLIRLLLLCLSARAQTRAACSSQAPAAATTTEPGCEGTALEATRTAQQQQQQQQGGWACSSSDTSDVTITDALLCVMGCAAPGAEVAALAALQQLTSAHRLAPLLLAAQRAMHRLPCRHPRLAWAAAGVAFRAQPDSQSVAPFQGTPGAPYPLPSTLPQASAVSAVLMGGYAAAWLSMVAAAAHDGDSDHSRASSVNAGGSSSSEKVSSSGGGGGRTDTQQGEQSGTRALPSAIPRGLLLRHPQPALPCPTDSRLPAPPTWLVSEVLQLPRAAATASNVVTTQATGTVGNPSSRDAHTAPLHPVGAALLLVRIDCLRPSACEYSGSTDGGLRCTAVV